MFFRLTGAVALQNLILLGVSLCDNMMLGGYNELAMSGVAIVIQIQFLLQLTVNGVGTGAAVIASQHWGKRETAPIRRVFGVAFCAALAVGCLLGVLGFFIPGKLLGLLTNEAEVIEQGVQYMRILAPSYPLLALTSVGIAMFRSVESTQVGVYLSLAALGLDTALNYVLIYGKLGFPSLGVRGAAIATVISYIAQFVMLVCYLCFVDKKLRMRLRECFHIEKIYLQKFLRIALPLVGSGLSWGLAMGVQSAILGRMGKPSIAANAMVTALFQVITVVAYAAAAAANVVIGKAVGQGDRAKVKLYARTLQLIFLCIGLCTSAALLLARGGILQFYQVSEATGALAKQFLLVLCVTVAGTSYQMASLTGIVSGGGDTRFVLVNDLIFMWGIVLPLSALSAFVWHLSPLITFIFLKSDQIAKCAVAVVKVNRFRWIRDLTK
jgi:putative MATE family efflux protein